MQTLEKRSSESVKYDIDCSLLLAPGETITSVTSISATPVTTPALSFGAGAINVSPSTYTDDTGNSRIAPVGTVVQVLIGGGKIPTNQVVQVYVIRCLVATSINPAVEATVRLQLNDTPSY